MTKLVTPDEKQARLFRLVAFITGWKNSFKGIGYFIGAALLSVSYYAALGWSLASLGGVAVRYFGDIW